jgi:hypothetical protein
MEQPLRLAQLRHEVTALVHADRNDDGRVADADPQQPAPVSRGQPLHTPTASASQPPRNASPPSGVTAPQNRMPVHA